jgi:hypothetical protein
MKYENKDVGYSFEVPDTLTVRQQLGARRRMFAVSLDDHTHWERFLAGGLPLIQKWKCEHVADLAAVDLDKETSTEITNVIMMVGTDLSNYFTDIANVKKTNPGGG